MKTHYSTNICIHKILETSTGEIKKIYYKVTTYNKHKNK